MLRLRKPILLVTSLSMLTLLLGVAFAKNASEQSMTTVLAIEIPMQKGPFTIPAAGPGKSVSAHVRIPVSDKAKPLSEQITALRLMPKVTDEKVEVKVFALYGDTSSVNTCDDWKNLKATFLGKYVAGAGEAITLGDLGLRAGDKPFSFSVVKFAVSPQVIVTACQCASCGQLSCCPNNGKCIGCGDCGSACCNIQEEPSPAPEAGGAN